jgi:hypothetical protein
MTASELKRNIELENPNSLFFSRGNMKFAGDTMANYGVLKTEILVNHNIEVYEMHRKKPTKNGLKSSSYFRSDNFGRIFKRK